MQEQIKAQVIAQTATASRNKVKREIKNGITDREQLKTIVLAKTGEGSHYAKMLAQLNIEPNVIRGMIDDIIAEELKRNLDSVHIPKESNYGSIRFMIVAFGVVILLAAVIVFAYRYGQSVGMIK